MAKDYSMQFNLKAKDNFSPTMKRAAATAYSSANKIAGADLKMASSSHKLSAALVKQSVVTKGTSAANMGLSKSLMGLVTPYASVTAATAALVLGLKSVVSSTVEAGDKVFDLAKRYGASTEFFSEMAHVAEQNGTNLDAVGVAMRSVSRRAALAMPAFEKFNVKIHDSNNQMKDAEGVFLAAVEAINALGTDQEKTAASMELFGDAGAGMLQVIKLGTEGIREGREEASEFGRTLSLEAAVAANQFNNHLGKLDSSMEGLKQSIGADLIPEIEHWIRVAIDVSKAVRENWASIKNMITTLNPLVLAVRYNAKWLSRLAEEFGYVDEAAEDAAASQKTFTDEATKAAEAAAAQGFVVKGLTFDLVKWRAERKRMIAEARREREQNEKAGQSYVDNEKKKQDAFVKARAAERMAALKERERVANYYNEQRAAEELARLESAARVQEIEQEAALARLETEQQTAMAVSNLIASSLTNMVSSVISGQATMAEAAQAMLSSLAKSAVNAVVDMAIKSGIESIFEGAKAAAKATASGIGAAADVAAAEVAVGASSTVAMAQSLAAYSMIPFAGPGLGLAQGTALVGQIQASRALMLAAEGGIAPFGTDTQPAMLTPGERVLTTHQTSLFERMVGALEGGAVGGRGGGDTVVFKSVVPPVSAEVDRSLRALDKRRKRMGRFMRRGTY